MNNDKPYKQIVKPAKCCFNCLYFNSSVDDISGYCYLNPDNNIIVYPYEYCKFFKHLN